MNLADYKSPIERKPETRNDVVKKFVVKLNEERVYNKRKPLAPRFYAIKMAHIKNIFELEAFYRDCESARNFSEWWWGRLKVKNNYERIDTKKQNPKR